MTFLQLPSEIRSIIYSYITSKDAIRHLINISHRDEADLLRASIVRIDGLCNAKSLDKYVKLTSVGSIYVDATTNLSFLFRLKRATIYTRNCGLCIEQLNPDNHYIDNIGIYDDYDDIKIIKISRDSLTINIGYPACVILKQSWKFKRLIFNEKYPCRYSYGTIGSHIRLLKKRVDLEEIKATDCHLCYGGDTIRLLPNLKVVTMIRERMTIN